MNRGTFLLLVLFVLNQHSAKSQRKTVEIPEQRFQELKTKTAIFIIPKTEYRYIDDYANMLPKAWTLTPLKVVKYEDLSPYLKDIGNYALFSIVGEQHILSSGPTNANHPYHNEYTSTHYSLSLLLPIVTYGKPEYRQLCRIELYPEAEAFSKFKDEEINPELSLTTTFRNFTLPYMMVYLKFVQQNLLNLTSPSVYKSYEVKALLNEVKNDTLYVPDSLIYSRNSYVPKDKLKDKDIFKGYPGKYKFVSTGELINIIKTRDESRPVYLFEYIISSSDKYVGVLEVRSGKVIYRKYTR